MANLLLGLALACVTRYDDLGVTASGLHTSDIDGPWLAVPAESIGTLYEYGDLVILRGIREDGSQWWYDGRVYDTGAFGGNCVRQADGCAPILFDIPAQHVPFDGLSAKVVGAYNISAEARRVH